MSFAQKIKAVLAIIRLLLEWLERPSPLPAATLDLIPGPVTEQDSDFVGVSTTETITNTQQITYTLAPKNRKGGPAAIDGAPTWAGSDDAIATVTPAADGLSAIVASVGPEGSITVTATADADLGAGVTPITGVATVVVSAAGATVVELTGSAVEEQP